MQLFALKVTKNNWRKVYSDAYKTRLQSFRGENVFCGGRFLSTFSPLAKTFPRPSFSKEKIWFPPAEKLFFKLRLSSTKLLLRRVTLEKDWLVRLKLHVRSLSRETLETLKFYLLVSLRSLAKRNFENWEKIIGRKSLFRRESTRLQRWLYFSRRKCQPNKYFFPELSRYVLKVFLGQVFAKRSFVPRKMKSSQTFLSSLWANRVRKKISKMAHKKFVAVNFETHELNCGDEKVHDNIFLTLNFIRHENFITRQTFSRPSFDRRFGFASQTSSSELSFAWKKVSNF